MKVRLKYILALFLFSALSLEFGCYSQSDEFILPRGNAEDGKRSFVALGCNQCHSADDIPWIGVEIEGDVHVKLNGQSKTPKSYNELLTSILNPSHKIEKKHLLQMTTKSWDSKMRNYTEILTVRDLLDIATFLHTEFESHPNPVNSRN